MGGVFRGDYPSEIRKVLRHAERLAKTLTDMEQSKTNSWLVGRAGELRAVLSGVIADWRSGVNDNERTQGAISAYVDELHRTAAVRLKCSPILECCDLQDAITAVFAELSHHTRASQAAARKPGRETTDEGDSSTIRTGWVDAPEVLALFHAEIALVERCARVLVRRIGQTVVTMDDLRGFGREGLLAAARSYNERHEVPFSHWATLRIRTAMIDGVRSWGNMAPRIRRQIQELADEDFAVESGENVVTDAPQTAEATIGAAVRRAPSAPVIAYRPAEPEQASSALGMSPEDRFSRAELSALLREVISRLPSKERALVERHHFHGETIEQAADALGLGKSWASRLHARAMTAIQRELLTLDPDVASAVLSWSRTRNV